MLGRLETVLLLAVLAGSSTAYPYSTAHAKHQELAMLSLPGGADVGPPGASHAESPHASTQLILCFALTVYSPCVPCRRG